MRGETPRYSSRVSFDLIALQRLAAGREQIARDEERGEDAEHQRDVESRELELLAAELNAGEGRTGHALAVGAAGDREELLQQRKEHHGNGEVEHAEEDRAVAHDEEADDRRKQARCRHADGDQDQRFMADLRRRQEGDRIGAEREEQAVAEGDLAGAEQHHDAERRQPLAEGDGQDHRRPGREQREDRERRDQREAEDELARHHTFLVCTVENRPCGRTSSTSIMMR